MGKTMRVKGWKPQDATCERLIRVTNRKELTELRRETETTHEIGHCSPLDKGEYRYGRRKQKEGSQTI